MYNAVHCPLATSVVCLANTYPLDSGIHRLNGCTMSWITDSVSDAALVNISTCMRFKLGLILFGICLQGIATDADSSSTPTPRV